MRYTTIESAAPGSVLMRNVYGYRGEILLKKGLTLDQFYINRLKKLRINGIYVSDDLSFEVEVASLISDSLKNKAVCDIRKTFKLFDSPTFSKKDAEESFNLINTTVSEFISEIEKKPEVCINMIDLKLFDDYTYFHCVNVALLSIVLGMAYGLSNAKVQKLGVAAMLHDIGKVKTPIEVLNKKEKLSDEEYHALKKHVELGYSYVKEKLRLSSEIIKGVSQHHERWDGSGYPHRLKEKDISLFGRIISIADVYDALISDRPYRKGYRPAEALEFLLANGNSDFDLELLEIFNRKIQPYPVGTVVFLSNNTKAIVSNVKPGFGTRPIVKVFESEGKKIPPFIIDLSKPEYNTIIITS
ncbi:MAG: HD-GYP domain-containing protein [Clostridia bacterium]